MRNRSKGIALGLGLALAAAQSAAAAGFETLSASGPQVLEACNPSNAAGNSVCKVTSLPGESGYDLVASRSAPLIVNDIVVGTLHDRVWRHCTDRDRYVFGMRVVMNAEAYDETGAAFNVNDLFRQTLPGKSVSIAYFLGSATKALKRSGRTVQGLNEFEGAQPERNNAWVNFRIDANAAEPSGASSAASPWLLTKTRAPKGIEINVLGLRVLNSDFEDFFQAVEFFTSSYQPVGVPPPDDEEEEGTP